MFSWFCFFVEVLLVAIFVIKWKNRNGGDNNV